MTQYLRESDSLRELDLSWSKLPPSSWRKFLAVIKTNRTLTSLNISHNKILEDQPKVVKKKPIVEESKDEANDEETKDGGDQEEQKNDE